MTRAAILAIALLAPLVASAQTVQSVQVQAFTLRPPSRITLTAVDGQLVWRSCATCAPGTGARVAVESAGGEVRLSTGEHVPEISVTGHYQLSGDAMPVVAGTNPILIRAGENHLQILFSMQMEDYVAAVLRAEGGDLCGNDARKAMAVVVRTYASRFRSRHTAEGFDFCDTTHCQVVRWDQTNARALAATLATQGEILTFDGSPAATYYHQNCGGTIAAAKEVWPDSGKPYLQSHPDPYCVAGNALQWESILSIADLDAAMRTSGLNPPRGWTAIEVARRSESGRAQRLRLAGGSAVPFLVSASSFRYAVGRALGWNKIRSDLYNVRAGAAGFIFSGRGAGHGVGLCQAGAEQMSLQGKGYREILNFYFPGTQIEKSSEVKWQQRFSDRFELNSTAPEQDVFVLLIAGRLLKQDEDAAGWKVTSRVRLQAFPTLDAFRDTTGQPGGVAASTRGNTIRLQPLPQLRARSILESTLRHELFHVLVESKAAAGTPLWFREGLVLYLSGEAASGATSLPMTNAEIDAILKQPRSQAEMERAYAGARALVAKLIEQNGRSTVLDWLAGGLPSGAGSGL